MFWSFGYFNNPFMMNTFFMPNFFFNFGFNNFGFQNLFMPSLFMFANPYNSSIFNNTQNRPAPRTKPERTFAGTAPARRQTSSINTQTNTEPAKAAVTPAKTNPIQTNKRNNSINKGDSAFIKKTKQIAKSINCDYKDLLALMNSESKINPKAVNPSSGATGLIQFMPQTAKDLGTTTEDLKNMTATEQLDYVEKYLKKYKKAAGFKQNEKLDAGDLYALVFLPGRAKRDIITDKSEKYYAANAPALDLNKDGKITKDELSQRMNSHRVSDSIFLA